MRKSRFTEAQIMGILRQVEGGIGIGRCVPGAHDQQCDILQMAIKVRWHGCLNDW